MNDKIDSALRIIEKGLEHSKSPCLAWSGGKDSMALLHLVFEQFGKRMPVVFFREPWQPHKYAFQHRVIEAWGLEVYTWHPQVCQFQQTGDEFEVQNLYLLDGDGNFILAVFPETSITLPISDTVTVKNSTGALITVYVSEIFYIDNS